MNIIEALKSGKNFKRKDWSTYLCYHDDHRFNCLDILADDWEYEERKKLIGREEFNKAWEMALDMSRNSLSIDLHGFRDRLMQLLGIR